MSADPAFAVESVEPEFSDGDGDPPTAVEIAYFLAGALQRIRARGPLFKKLVDDAVEAVQLTPTEGDLK